MTEHYVRPQPEDGWPACPTPDCENRVNLWAGLGLCSPCSAAIVGVDEMHRRWLATRVDGTTLAWTGESYSGA